MYDRSAGRESDSEGEGQQVHEETTGDARRTLRVLPIPEHVLLHVTVPEDVVSQTLQR